MAVQSRRLLPKSLSRSGAKMTQLSMTFAIRTNVCCKRGICLQRKLKTLRLSRKRRLTFTLLRTKTTTWTPSPCNLHPRSRLCRCRLPSRSSRCCRSLPILTLRVLLERPSRCRLTSFTTSLCRNLGLACLCKIWRILTLSYRKNNKQLKTKTYSS